MKMIDCIRAAVAIALLSMLGACSYPRIVTDITATDSQIKFMYSQAKWIGSPEAGLVKCKLDQENNMTACQDLGIQFEK